MPEELLDRDMRGPAPVFRAQINVLADGVALVLAVNHMVVDGTGERHPPAATGTVLSRPFERGVACCVRDCAGGCEEIFGYAW